MQGKQTELLLFVGVTVLALILLGAGLSNLELRPGQPLALLLERGPIGIDEGGPLSGNSIFEIVWRVLVFLFVILLPFAILQLIVSAEARRRVFRDLVIMLSFLFMYYALVRAVREGRLNLGEMPGTSPTPAAPSASASAEFAANPSEWFVFAISLGLAVLLTGLLVGAVWYIRRSRRSPLEQLAQEAQDALEEMRAGADFKNTVIRCYAEMSRILSERRGIDRQAGMTPREFEQRLIEVGLPHEDVRRLTRLFEDTRYGDKTPEKSQEREAEVYLTAIIHAAGGSS